MRCAYRIKATLETRAARDVRKVFLQTRKPFALEEYLVHALSRPRLKLPDVIAEEQFPAAKEGRYRSIRYCEMVADGEPTWRKQVLYLSSCLDELVWRLSAEEECGPWRSEFVRDRVDEEAHMRALYGVLWEKARVRVQVCDEFEQHQRFCYLCGLRGWVLRV